MSITERTYLVQLQEKREVDSLSNVLAQQLLNLLSKLKLEKTIPQKYQDKMLTPKENWVTISNYGVLDNLSHTQADKRAKLVAGSRIYNHDKDNPSRKTELKAVPPIHRLMLNKYFSENN